MNCNYRIICSPLVSVIFRHLLSTCRQKIHSTCYPVYFWSFPHPLRFFLAVLKCQTDCNYKLKLQPSAYNFFVAKLNKHLPDVVLHWQLQPIPSEESLQQKLQDNTNWEAYKALTVVNHMVQHKAHGDSQFFWVNPGINSLLWNFYILYLKLCQLSYCEFWNYWMVVNYSNFTAWQPYNSCHTRQTKGR